MEAVRGFPAHLEAPLAAGIVSVRYPLLYGFSLKLGEHDTDIQHRPPHRDGGIKLLRRGHKLYIVLLEQLHHVSKVQNGTADTVELVNHDKKLLTPLLYRQQPRKSTMALENLMPRLPLSAVCRHTCGIPHKAAAPAPGVLPLPAPA